MRRAHWLALLLLLGVSKPASVWAADSFDLIYCDHVAYTFIPGQLGATLADYGFALIVNTASVPLESSALASASFSSSSSVPGIQLTPFVGNLPGYAPIPPGVAIGSIRSQNAMLEDFLRTNEELRNTAPDQVLAWSFWRSAHVTYTGPVYFDVAVTVGEQQVRFQVEVDLQYGEPGSTSFLSASRVSSSGITAVAPMTWGRLKDLYH
jgi:hypothetical protein